MDWLGDPQAWIGFVTLAALEIVLGIDNRERMRRKASPVHLREPCVPAGP